MPRHPLPGVRQAILPQLGFGLAGELAVGLQRQPLPGKLGAQGLHLRLQRAPTCASSISPSYCDQLVQQPQLQVGVGLLVGIGLHALLRMASRSAAKLSKPPISFAKASSGAYFSRWRMAFSCT